MLIIESNGSKWAGEEPEGIDYLLATLAETPLNPEFGEHIALAHRWTSSWNDAGERVYQDTGPLYPEHPDAVCFTGNFWRKSSVFQIYTDDPELVAKLTAAILANQASEAYQAARAQCLPTPPAGQLTLFGAP